MSAYGDLAAQKPTGLAALARQMEAEHADEAAQASVEGRVFAPPVGGIERSPNPYWNNRRNEGWYVFRDGDYEGPYCLP